MCAPAGASCLQAGDIDRYYASSASLGNLGQGIDFGVGEHPGILLGARAVGDWTNALNEYALRAGEDLRSPRCLTHPSNDPHTSSSEGHDTSHAPDPVPVPVQVMFDGPYGGCTLDLESYERVLLVAGGSGATFMVGVLDELVAGCCLSASGNGRSGGRAKTERVDFIWCVRSYGKSPLFLSFLPTPLLWMTD